MALQERHSDIQVGIEVKFTNAMEEVFVLLLLLCIIQNIWSGKGFVKQLIILTNKTPKTIGVTLQKLADFQLISYTRDGKGQKITINLKYEFVQTQLISLFGYSEEENKKSAVEKFEIEGLFPSNLNFTKEIILLEEAIKNTDQEIDDHLYYLNWIEEQKNWASEVKEIDFDDLEEALNNPLYQFAEDLVTIFKREKPNRANGVTVQLQRKIILERLEAEQAPIPWLSQFSTKKNFRIEDV